MDKGIAGQAFEHVCGWVADWQRQRHTQAELEGLGREGLEQLAQDIGVGAGELAGPEAARKMVPGHDALMPARLEAVGLDPESVRRCDPATYRDLERVCAKCQSVRRCKRDTAQGDIDVGMREYCLNAPTIDALVVERGG